VPSATVRSFAARAGVPVSKVEGYWDWAKAQADIRFKARGQSYWAYVSALTQRRLGLKEARQATSFKDFLALTGDKYLYQPRRKE